MFSKRTDWPLAENALTKKISELKNQNVQILDLTESNPTQAGFSYPKEILSQLSHPNNLRYQPSSKGLPETREAIAQYYAEKKIAVDPEQIIVTASTSESYSYLFRLLTNPGDSILAPTPSYPLLNFLAGLNDVCLNHYPLQHVKGSWSIDFTHLKLESDAKALIVVHPNNPTGSFVKSFELERLNQFAKEGKCAIIADEVFLDYKLQKTLGAVPSFTANQDALTFTLSGISKILGLPQMKLGWIAVSGPRQLAKEAINRLEIVSDTFLSVNTPVQNAFKSWLPYQCVIQKEILARTLENRKTLETVGRESKAFELLSTEGGWYAILRIKKKIDEEKIAIGLLENHHVLLHPGYFFDFTRDSHLVVSLLPEKQIFNEGAKKTSHYLSRI